MSSFIPKYKKIANILRESILSGEYAYNEPVPTEHQIMNKYKVSRQTVRRALDILTEENLIYSIKGSGTYVNYNYEEKRIKEGGNIKIGVITTYISEYIFPAIIRGIENTFKKNNVTLMLASTDNDFGNEKESIENLIENGVKGLIIEPTKSNQLNPNLDYCLKLKKLGIPFVLINAKNEYVDSSYVVFNDFKAGFDVTSHLIDYNHEKIAIISKIDDLQGKERLRGYLKALEDNSLYNTFIYTFSSKEENEIVEKFFKDYKNNKVTSLVCYNDNLASIVIKHANMNNIRIPEDLSIVGIDDSQISENLNITSYRHPKSKLGTKSAEILLDHIYKKNQNYEKYTFEGSIVLRKTSSKI